MKLITTDAEVQALKKGNKIRKVWEDETTDYEVYENFNMASNIDLLHLPLIVPDVVVVKGKPIVNTAKVGGNFPIHRTHEDLVDGTWYIL